MNAPTRISSAITMELDVETAALVDRLASSRGLSVSQYAAEAIRGIAESEADYEAFLQVGIDELDRGEGIPHEVVMAEFKEMIAERRMRCGA